jgi:alpha-glucosidase
VVFESPLNMLCDSPSNYIREQECLEFIAEIPTVWDETKGVSGKVEDHIVMARRSGDVWYVGGMTGWDSKSLELSLDFLPEGEYTVEIFVDGANAYRLARDYKKVVSALPADRKLTVQMAPGGGFAAIIKPIR